VLSRRIREKITNNYKYFDVRALYSSLD
jgi:hypothetical protein